MNTEEEKIEQILKEKISHINPSRAFFESTMQSVTKDEFYRNKRVEVELPSLYQLTNNFFMKKIALIGIPVAIFAIVLIVGIKGSDKQIVKVEPVETNTKLAENNTNISPKEENSFADASVDNIVASFVADADSDALDSLSESEDEASINSELESFNSLKTYSYENNI